MNKKKIIIIFFTVFFVNGFYAENVEFLLKSKEAHFESHGPYEAYNGISVDEINENLLVHNGKGNGAYIINYNSKSVVYDERVQMTGGNVSVKLKDFWISFLDSGVFLQLGENNITSIYARESIKRGISFILKKNKNYIVYYVDAEGIPGAADTEGKIYSNKEAVEYLKQYDSEKYEESLLRAEELGLKEKFLNSEVLVWGQRYYSSLDEMAKVLGKSGLILYDLIQYDMQGNAYQIDFGWWGNYKNDWGVLCEEGTEDNSDFVCEDVNGNRTVLLSNLNEYSKILGRNGDYQEKRPAFSTSWYVGFGGNIYYYIAGEEYTEVFRIRRTWGDPDFYAMAVNGYTEDEYGKYVNEVLPKLSKAELRLLRNTVFALYGVHFRSEDLAKHFDKQVWYTDEGKTSADVTLPAHRQKLVEMIQALEK